MMSRWKVISIVIVLSLGIGCTVPALTLWYANQGQAHTSTLSPQNSEAVLTSGTSAKKSYHFGLEQGVLSVVEGKPGEQGNVIITGLNIESWPKEILEMAPKVEFYSLDEVQSFIDTAQESLWME